MPTSPAPATPGRRPTRQRGAIAWMARNHVPANLIMVLLIGGGLLMAGQIKQEIFPELNLDFVFVRVPFPGASPAEVEEGIILAIEEEARALDDVKEVRSYAREGIGITVIELQLGANANKALADIKNVVDAIKTFPKDAERPTVSLAVNERHVVSVVLYGQQSERLLRSLAEQAREELLKSEQITQVSLSGVRQPEIGIEISQENLRRYGLTLEQVAGQIRQSALDLPGGRVKAAGGEILVRTKERRYLGREYEGLPVIIRNDGTQVTLGEIATVRDDFEDSDISATYNGFQAVRIDVFRVGDQTLAEVSAAAKAYVERLNQELPPTVRAAVWEDNSEILNDRIELLLRNALFGLALVLLLLGLSLDIRLAFWVTMGIPTSILGTLLFFPVIGISINMVSLFAIIITIGIVVDDAVIVGENIYSLRSQGMSYLDAAIVGAREMAVPVTFSILTNIAAFVPLAFVPGVTGKVFKVIPLAVITTFVISLLEALFILPAHLAARTRGQEWSWIEMINRRREWFGNLIAWIRDRPFRRALAVALEWRYASLAVAAAMLILSIGVIGSGRVDFAFTPKIEADRLTANVAMPVGSPVEQTKLIRDQLVAAARAIIANNGGDSIVRGLYTQVGSPPPVEGPVSIGSVAAGPHMASVSVYLVPIDNRSIRAEEFVRQWYQQVRDIPGIDSLSFRYSTGPATSKPINFLLTHSSTTVLEHAAADLADSLQHYAGVRDIDDGFSAGKTQLDFKIKPVAQSLGLTASDLASQVRSAFYGAEALRLQRGRDEVKVMVRLPEAERRSRYNIEDLMVRAPSGAEIPLLEAAEVIPGTSYTEIVRSNGRRVLNVTADVEEGTANADKVVSSVRATEIPRLLEQYPGLKLELAGEQKDNMEAMRSLGFGFIFALFGIYALLAIPFKSYSQPIIIMTSIPFGMIGALLGHIIMGYEMSIISMFGVIALSGVVVNDSLILIDAANYRRRNGSPYHEAIFEAACRRFRPILLTSLTTFLGLAPMIFETSIQARALIPMAISLGFGLLFATAIALVIIPCLYLALVDVKRLLGFEPPAAALADELTPAEAEV